MSSKYGYRSVILDNIEISSPYYTRPKYVLGVVKYGHQSAILDKIEISKSPH